jgi:D-alanine-D-alanine ligase
MHYIVLGGGISPEKEVSKRSAAAVKSALIQLGHEVTYIDPLDTPINTVIEAAKQTDGVFPILHGLGGEDGLIQKYLEAANVPYFGPSFKSCENTYDKSVFKRLLKKHTLPTPSGNVVTPGSFMKEPLAKAPFVLKPLGGGSSIDTFIIRTLPYDETPLLEALHRYGTMLIEELIVGTEITVGVLGTTALPVIEIIPPQEQEFDYENKYNGATLELCPPENVSAKLQKQAQELALKVHLATECRHISRTDIMINSNGEMFIIDTNTIPGLTDKSLLPKAAATAGYSWVQLVQKFTELI